MCFGGEKTTQQVSQQQTQAPPSWLSDAAAHNLGFAQSLINQGFTPYAGNQVAGFSPQQQQSFNYGGDVAGGVQPYVGMTGGLLANYATAGPQRVNANSIASQMSPYMNQYVQQALAPQLELQNQQFAAQNKGFDASATGAGAFGDTGWGLGRANLTQQQDTARTGLIGNAYNSAFNTAIGAGAQDVANNLNAQGTNANLAETALGRQLTGAGALFGEGTQGANLLNTLGGQQTAQQQAQLNAAYNQWLMGQQYPFQALQAMNQTIGAGRQGAPINTTGQQTTQAPDNSGYGLLGAGLGMAANYFLPGAGSFVSGMFNSGNSPGAKSNYGGYNNTGLPGFAEGGTPPPGIPSVVGEKGPELFVPNTQGTVIPNDMMQQFMRARMGNFGGGPWNPWANGGWGTLMGSGDPAAAAQPGMNFPQPNVPRMQHMRPWRNAGGSPTMPQPQQQQQPAPTTSAPQGSASPTGLDFVPPIPTGAPQQQAAPQSNAPPPMSQPYAQALGFTLPTPPQAAPPPPPPPNFGSMAMGPQPQASTDLTQPGTPPLGVPVPPVAREASLGSPTGMFR